MGYDAFERCVYAKLIPSPNIQESNEREIITLLNSPLLREDPYNHTIPVLAQLDFYDWTILVTPAWSTTLDATHLLVHIYELLDMGKQLLQVCSKISTFVNVYIESLSGIGVHASPPNRSQGKQYTE